MVVLRQNLTYSLRRLSRSPGLVAAVILSIGLGIAANSTIFSMVSRFVLRPRRSAIPPRSCPSHHLRRQPMLQSISLAGVHRCARSNKVVFRRGRLLRALAGLDRWHWRAGARLGTSGYLQFFDVVAAAHVPWPRLPAERRTASRHRPQPPAMATAVRVRPRDPWQIHPALRPYVYRRRSGSPWLSTAWT